MTSTRSSPPTVLVIAATDSSGGAGLARDIRVLNDMRVEVTCAVTAVTAQSDTRVTAIHPLPATMVRAQILAACETRRIDAIKIGMLGTRATVEVIADCLPTEVPVVLDPVLVSSSGGVLLDVEARAAMIELLFPRATLVTPNIPEAAALLGSEVSTHEAQLFDQARRLLQLGPDAVLLKGGHAEAADAVDLLVSRDGSIEKMTASRRHGSSRGTGCALACVVAAQLADSVPLSDACREAKRYVLGMLDRASSS